MLYKELEETDKVMTKEEVIDLAIKDLKWATEYQLGDRDAIWTALTHPSYWNGYAWAWCDLPPTKYLYPVDNIDANDDILTIGYIIN